MFFVTAVLAGAQGTAGRTADELAAAAMRLDQGEGGVDSIETTIVLNTGRAMTADVRVGKMGSNWLAVYSSSDGTPLLICGQGRAVLYDLMAGVVRVYRSAHFGAAIWSEEGRLEVHFNLLPDEDHLLLDIRSLVAAASEQRQAHAEGSLWVLSGLTARRGRLIARVDPGKRNSYSSLEIFTASRKEAALAIGPIIVNQPPSRQSPPLPDEKALATRLRVVDAASPWTTPATQEEAQKAQEGTLIAWAGLHAPALRSDIEKQYEKPIDWSLLKTRDAAMSAVLRDLAGRKDASDNGQPATEPHGAAKSAAK